MWAPEDRHGITAAPLSILWTAPLFSRRDELPARVRLAVRGLLPLARAVLAGQVRRGAPEPARAVEVQAADHLDHTVADGHLHDAVLVDWQKGEGRDGWTEDLSQSLHAATRTVCDRMRHNASDKCDEFLCHIIPRLRIRAPDVLRSNILEGAPVCKLAVVVVRAARVQVVLSKNKGELMM